jgi:hypothetical protein
MAVDAYLASSLAADLGEGRFHVILETEEELQARKMNTAIHTTVLESAVNDDGSWVNRIVALSIDSIEKAQVEVKTMALPAGNEERSGSRNKNQRSELTGCKVMQSCPTISPPA